MTAAEFLREAAAAARGSAYDTPEEARGLVAAVADWLDAEAFALDTFPAVTRLIGAIVADVSGREVRISATSDPHGIRTTADTSRSALAVAAQVLGREWVPA